MPRPPRPQFPFHVFLFFHTLPIFICPCQYFLLHFHFLIPLRPFFRTAVSLLLRFASMSPFGIGPEHSSDSVALARLPPPELESHQARIWSGTFHICEDILAVRISGDIAACDQLNGGTAHSSGTQSLPKYFPST